MEIDHRIYVFVKEKNIGILKFPQYSLETIAYLGKNGVTTEKKEGDGKTPIGEFRLGALLGMHPDEKNVNGLKYQQITNDLYWVDDPKSKRYNQLVDITKVKKDWESAEHLMDYPTQYEYLIEIKTNPSNILGKGSAIFLHCANHKPTAGCIAVDREIMKKIITSIDEQTTIKIDTE